MDSVWVVYENQIRNPPPTMARHHPQHPQWSNSSRQRGAGG